MIQRKSAFVLRSFFGAVIGAAVVAAAVVGAMGYAIFTTSEIATIVLNELASALEFVYIESDDDALLNGLKAIVEQMAEVALVLFGIWYAFPLFAKALLAHVVLALVGWSQLWSYLVVGYVAGALMGARALLTEEIQQVALEESDVLFNAFAIDGPSLAATLAIVWLWSYEKRNDRVETPLL